jgi:CelD/BcsL family acetyltransferase involved in cellulose biosynthesis
MTMEHLPASQTRTSVTSITLPDLAELWSIYRQSWQWHIPFMTPPWLTAWWHCIANDVESLLLKVTLEEQPVGVAPLLRQGKTARFMGSADLCDCGDFPAQQDNSVIFCSALLHYLKMEGVRCLILESVRPDSLVRQVMVPTAQQEGWRVTIKPVSTSLEMNLPATWKDYLQGLDPKQRHEMQRKIRRVAEAGNLEQKIIRHADGIDTTMDIFFRLFRQSRPDKEEFMTARRESFFRMLAKLLCKADMLNLLFLSIDSRPAAAVFCVDYKKTTFLYNNGFDPRFRSNSLGIVSKLMTIKTSIKTAQQAYDFLCGTERYKYDMGGHEIPLSRCVFEY